VFLKILDPHLNTPFIAHVKSKHAFPVSLCTLVVTRARYTPERAHNALDSGPVRQAVFWLISRLWLICCERKTLFHS
jgi:hypothetical protein